MSDTKILHFGENGSSGGSVLGALAPMLQQRGLDPNMVFAMMNGRNSGGFGGEGGWFMWVIFLFFLMGWGNGGWGSFGGFGGNRGGLSQGGADLAALINNDNGRELLMSAIQGNGTAISQLAATLNCDINAVQGSLNALTTQLSSIGSQIGMSGQQIINAIQSGNCQIATQIADCCCKTQNAITTQGYEGQLRTIQQTQDIVQNATSNANILAAKIDAQTQILNDKFCQLEMREMQSKLDAERARSSALAGQLSQEHQTQTIQASNAQMFAPVNTALADLSARLAKIECKAPETVTLPYSPVVGVPSCVAAQYGLFGANGFAGLSGGFWG